MDFYAEDKVDRWIYWDAKLPDSGIYVDAGCAGPFKYSNTAFLREKGWNGIAIDGDPAYAPEWEGVQGAKFIHAVLGLGTPSCFLVEPTNSLVSRIHPLGAPVQTRTLGDIVGEYYRKINFLSLDLEGVEFDVMQKFPLEIHAPDIIVAEYNCGHTGKDFRLLEHLLRNGYQAVHITDSNIVYRRR